MHGISDPAAAPAADPAAAPAADQAAAPAAAPAADQAAAPAADPAAAPAADPAAAPAADPAAAPVAADPAAANYDNLVMPEGYQVDETMHANFLAMAKENGYSPEQVQAVIDFDAQRTAAATKAAQDHWAATTAEWANALKADPELGGDNQEQNLAVANKAIDAFGGEALRAFLAESGLDGHPELLRAFYRAGSAISEDAMLTAGSHASGNKSFYKNSNMNH